MRQRHNYRKLCHNLKSQNIILLFHFFTLSSSHTQQWFVSDCKQPGANSSFCFFDCGCLCATLPLGNLLKMYDYIFQHSAGAFKQTSSREHTAQQCIEIVRVEKSGLLLDQDRWTPHNLTGGVSMNSSGVLLPQWSSHWHLMGRCMSHLRGICHQCLVSIGLKDPKLQLVYQLCTLPEPISWSGKSMLFGVREEICGKNWKHYCSVPPMVSDADEKPHVPERPKSYCRPHGTENPSHGFVLESSICL